MLFPLVALVAATAITPRIASAPDGPSDTYVGTAKQVHVRIPRLDEDVHIDGRLDEAAWRQAALLTGFSQFSPQDGIAADDSTQVRVWYSATAIYFGIRAFERHGTPVATLADRDRIDSDDQVQILLSTFNDSRQALVFGVNPLGVQMDGTILENNRAQSGSFMTQVTARQQADLSQDFVFQSKGRVTEYGYEVEIRIPFKSLRYQPAETQTWGLNIVRVIQHSGFEDTWAPARRAAASFLGQSGTLDGLTDLRRGLVLDVNPEATQRTVGAPCPPTVNARWCYGAEHAVVGGNARWGITNNLTLNGTVNPDFSQIESDAGQFVFDPRQALYFAEKRPFFLEGMEGFSTPSQLVYTRRIQQPVFATKLTGKISGTSVAFLSAVDDRPYSLSYDPATGLGGTHPVYTIARVSRDLGDQSHIGATYTGRLDDNWSNNVADVDGSLVFRKLYSLAFQAAGSRTADKLFTRRTTEAPLWGAAFDRNGKRFGFDYAIQGLDENFLAASGFIGRPGVVNSTVDHRITLFGSRDAWLQAFTLDPVYYLTWKYRYFTDGRDAIEKKFHINTHFQLRGGWNAGFSLLLETFGYDSDLFPSTYVERVRGALVDTIPFTGTPRLPNRDWVVSMATPQWQRFSMNALYLWGQDENFYEWASSFIVYSSVGALVRPTDKLRISPSWQYQSYNRRTTEELVASARDTRVKAEYQIARPLFFRIVGEYTAADRLALRDESRTNGQLLYKQPNGSFVASTPARDHMFRADWLISYQPNPGTVFFAGYGSTYARDESDPALLAQRWRTEDLLAGARRTTDAFFVKASYLLRM
ncbi:MAG TPA: DUF5916 domain-containing protein [Gemmatimonadaceae bacterium]|nr:DUF5916 domain-containing protein [Gemmatimonadaceae bacterium]